MIASLQSQCMLTWLEACKLDLKIIFSLYCILSPRINYHSNQSLGDIVKNINPLWLLACSAAAVLSVTFSHLLQFFQSLTVNLWCEKTVTRVVSVAPRRQRLRVNRQQNHDFLRRRRRTFWDKDCTIYWKLPTLYQWSTEAEGVFTVWCFLCRINSPILGQRKFEMTFLIAVSWRQRSKRHIGIISSVCLYVRLSVSTSDCLSLFAFASAKCVVEIFRKSQ